jgi:heme/copper-type cytochrome/quinol oxidase subunit 1
VHTQVRRFIKTAIAFLGLGLAIGVWLLVRRELTGQHPNPYETSAHTHALLVGFVMEMILGVALWLFPRPDKTDTRYSPLLTTIAYWALTAGTLVRVVAELLRAQGPRPELAAAIIAGGIAQTSAILLFFYTMWSRIRPLGSRVREAAGERF